MTITTLPTQTSGSLGSEKSNVKSLTDETHQLSAEQWNETVETVIALANEVGLSDGTTDASLNKRVAALEESGGSYPELEERVDDLEVAMTSAQSSIASLLAVESVSTQLLIDAVHNLTAASGSYGTSSNQRFFTDVAYGDNRYVSVGYDRYEYGLGSGQAGVFATAIAASLSSWSVGAFTTGTASKKINSIDFGAGVFVCVGSSGLIYTTTDGATFTARTAPGSYTGEYYCVRFFSNSSLFVAVGSGGAIHTSPDGITWTAQTNPDTSLDPVAIACNSSTIVIRTKGPSGFALTSTNGTAYTKQASVAGTDPQYGNQLCWDGENFVCFGTNVSLSPDGSSGSWYVVGSVSATMDTMSVTGKNGFLIGSGYDSVPKIIYSLDSGATWNDITTEDMLYRADYASLAIPCVRYLADGRIVGTGGVSIDSADMASYFLYSKRIGHLFS